MAFKIELNPQHIALHYCPPCWIKLRHGFRVGGPEVPAEVETDCRLRGRWALSVEQCVECVQLCSVRSVRSVCSVCVCVCVCVCVDKVLCMVFPV